MKLRQARARRALYTHRPPRQRPPPMRLTDAERTAIKEVVARHDPAARVLLFGSRTDDGKRGGDLLMDSPTLDRAGVRAIRLDLEDRIGEQKIDIVILRPRPRHLRSRRRRRRPPAMTVATRPTLLAAKLDGLARAARSRERARSLCAELAAQDHFSDTQLDRIEVFASRFGRTTDFLINKVLRSLDACEDYGAGTPLDRVHRAEKRGLVAHEYLADDLVPLLAELHRLTLPLLAAIAVTQIYGRRLLANT
ncbi:MAG: hypothetical protein H7343_11415 [Undibacterium sp.]|nr:hypothetical protein [Opitutaceae bacterium]